MEKFLGKALITSAAVLVADYLIKGVHIDNDNVVTAVLVAVVLGLLNTFIKPILILFTIPITFLTLGLFLLVINILIVKWVSNIVPSFRVDDWWAALLFSIVVSFFSSIIQSLIKTDSDKK